jgi:hypothetical protein
MIARAAVEKFGEDSRGPFGAGFTAGFAGVPDEHAGGHVEEDDQVAFAKVVFSALGGVTCVKKDAEGSCEQGDADGSDPGEMVRPRRRRSLICT